MDDPIVRIEHLREAGICLAGARRFATKMDFDFRDFLKNGLPASVLEATGDHFALTVAEIARKGKKNG